MAPHPIAPGDPFLYHKTTHRQLYAAAAASRGDADDVLLWNPAGELTEATIANIAVQLDGRWLTPPVSCGLLPGTQRAELLASGAWQEGIVTRADLARATGLHLANALRGVWPAALPVAGA
jgi:para-aminobenzoate synthetase/4-amino-4-deoxychorismate lyase